MEARLTSFKIALFLASRVSSHAIDLFSKVVQPTGIVDLGVHALKGGANTIAVKVIGKNGRSSAQRFGLDYILLKLVP